MEGIAFRYRTEISWRDLPRDRFGPGHAERVLGGKAVPMTETIGPMMLDDTENHEMARAMVARVRATGVGLVGSDGLLAGLTKQVLELALEEELTEHLGDEAGDRDAKIGMNERNGTRTETVITEIGPVHLEVPRDREGTFEPAIVNKRQRRLKAVDELVLSLTARQLMTGEISAHFAKAYGAQPSKDTVSRITEKVVTEMSDWQTRPLDAVGDLHRRDRGEGP